MKVPSYERQVGRESVMPATQKLAAPSQAAAQSEQDLARVGAEASKIGSGIADKIAAAGIARQQQDDEKQLLQVNTEYLQSKQDTLYSADLAANDEGRDVPVGLLRRELGNAKGAVIAYDADYAEKKAMFLERVPGDNQKRVLAKLMDQDYISTREQIARHEREQDDKDYALTAEANVGLHIENAASMTNTAAISAAIQTAVGIQSAALSRLGSSKEVVAQKSQSLANEIVKSAVEGNLEKDWRTSDAILHANKDRISPKAFEKMSQVVEGKRLYDFGVNAWQAMSSLRLADGTPDFEVMQTSIMAMKEINAEQKDKVWSYVKARASEDIAIMNRNDESRDREFFNAASTGRKNGTSLDDALKQSARYAKDSYDQLQKAEFLRKLYSAPTASNQDRYLQLWAAVQDGRATQKDIDAARGDLSASDYESLWKDRQKVAVEGTSPVYKQEWDNIEALANKKYSGDDVKKFMYVMKIKARGKAPEELRKIADEELKNIDVPGYFFKQTKWKEDLKALDEKNMKTGAVIAVNRKIAEDAPVPGTAANRAVLWLQKNKKLVNSETIARVLAAPEEEWKE